MTGSKKLHVMEKVNQTLAGRTAIVILLPFSLNELLGEPSIDPRKVHILPDKRGKPSFEFEKIISQGFYPRIHDQKLDPQDWLSAFNRPPSSL